MNKLLIAAALVSMSMCGRPVKKVCTEWREVLIPEHQGFFVEKDTGETISYAIPDTLVLECVSEK